MTGNDGRGAGFSDSSGAEDVVGFDSHFTTSSEISGATTFSSSSSSLSSVSSSLFVTLMLGNWRSKSLTSDPVSTVMRSSLPLKYGGALRGKIGVRAGDGEGVARGVGTSRIGDKHLLMPPLGISSSIVGGCRRLLPGPEVL
jgi:hypothetical protein